MNGQSFTVMQVLPDLESGGVERGTVEVAEELVRRGHRSIVLSGGGRLVEKTEQTGSLHIEWPIGKKSPLTFAYASKLRRLLVKESVDILHVRSRLPAWIAWIAWKTLPQEQRPRFVTTVHGLNSVNRYSEIMTRGEAVIVPSETIRNHVLCNYPRTNPVRLKLIYRGIDPDQFPHGYVASDAWTHKFRDQHPQLASRKIITLPGRITRLKGHLEFLDLIHDLRTTGIGVHGLIVGGEDHRRRNYANEIRQRVSELGLTSEITFAGHRDDMKEIYSISDLVVSLSSQPESFGRTVLETLSLGVPVIGYDHGGVGEVLARVFPEGRVSAGNCSELCQRVRSMLESRPTVEPFDDFSLSEMLDSLMKLYKQLLTGEWPTTEASSVLHRLRDSA